MVVKMTKAHCVVCNVIAGMFAVFIFGPALWWSLDRDPAYEMRNGVANFGAANSKSGDALDIIWGEVEIFRTGCHGTFKREIEDELDHTFTFAAVPSLYTDKPKGVYRNVHSMVPWEIPPGVFREPKEKPTAKIRMRSHIKSICNPIQELFPVYTVTKDVVAELPRVVLQQGPRGRDGRQGERGEQGEQGERGGSR